MKFPTRYRAARSAGKEAAAAFGTHMGKAIGWRKIIDIHKVDRRAAAWVVFDGTRRR